EAGMMNAPALSWTQPPRSTRGRQSTITLRPALDFERSRSSFGELTAPPHVRSAFVSGGAARPARAPQGAPPASARPRRALPARAVAPRSRRALEGPTRAPV